MLRFKVIRINKDGSYHTIPFKGETFQDLIKRLKNGSLSFDLDRERTTVELFYSSNEVESFQWQVFTSVPLSELRDTTGKCYHDRGEKFFPYRNTTYIDLPKYQIFSRNDNYSYVNTGILVWEMTISWSSLYVISIEWFDIRYLLH